VEEICFVNLYEFVLDDGSRKYEFTAVVAAECLAEADLLLLEKLRGDFARFRPLPGHLVDQCPTAAIVFSGDVNAGKAMRRLLRRLRKLLFKVART
jgi:hypothetical protein